MRLKREATFSAVVNMASCSPTVYKLLGTRSGNVNAGCQRKEGSQAPLGAISLNLNHRRHVSLFISLPAKGQVVGRRWCPALPWISNGIVSELQPVCVSCSISANSLLHRRRSTQTFVTQEQPWSSETGRPPHPALSSAGVILLGKLSLHWYQQRSLCKQPH